MKKQRPKLIFLSVVIFLSFLSYTYVNYSYQSNIEIESITIDEIDDDNAEKVDIETKILILAIDKIGDMFFRKI